jgi:hypothetical protein
VLVLLSLPSFSRLPTPSQFLIHTIYRLLKVIHISYKPHGVVAGAELHHFVQLSKLFPPYLFVLGYKVPEFRAWGGLRIYYHHEFRLGGIWLVYSGLFRCDPLPNETLVGKA